MSGIGARVRRAEKADGDGIERSETTEDDAVTKAEFMEALSTIRGLEIGSGGMIRQRCRDRKRCPIVAVCRKVIGIDHYSFDYLEAGKDLGLNPKTAEAIAAASDGDVGHKRLRAELEAAIAEEKRASR